MPPSQGPKCPTCDPEMQQMIKETHMAVCGHAELGVTGLVKRMERNERKVRRLTFFGTVIGAAALGSWLGLKQFVVSLFTR